MGLFNRPPEQAPQGPPMFPGQPMIKFDDDERDDLTRFQVDLTKTKSEMAHWLNGDMPEENDKGKVVWKINTNDKYRVLNEFGVREVMRIANMYLTKDVILSNLDEATIKMIAGQIGDEINDLFFTKYDEIGLDSDSRLKNYSSIVITLTHIIYITLMRAKDGKERQGITENHIVNENNMNIPSNYPRSGMNVFGRRR